MKDNQESFSEQLKILEAKTDDMLALVDTSQYNNEEFFELAKDALFLGSQAENAYQIFECLTFAFDVLKLYYYSSNLAMSISCRAMLSFMSELMYLYGLPKETADQLAHDAIDQATARLDASERPSSEHGLDEFSLPSTSKKTTSDLN